MELRPEVEVKNKDTLRTDDVLRGDEWLVSRCTIIALKRQATGSHCGFDNSSWLELLMARRHGDAAANRDAMPLAALAALDAR